MSVRIVRIKQKLRTMLEERGATGEKSIAQYPIRKEMKIFLSDLEANVMEGTKTLVVFRKRWRIWALIFFIIGTILLVLGILRAMRSGS